LRFAKLIAATVPLALPLGCHASPAGPGLPDGSGAGGRDWQRYPAVFTMTGAQEIDVVGDLHGDPEAATRVLAAAGLITAAAPHHWTGGARTLIVTGDVIDKGAAATPIIDLFLSLEPEAAAAGGHAVVTLGNHEAEFVADPTADKVADFRGELTALGLDPAAVAAGQSRFGAWLLTRPVAALVDGWFFCHAGAAGGMTATEIARAFQATFLPDGRGNFADPFLIGPGSLLEASSWWTSGADPASDIDFDLAVLPAHHLVFGHDPGALDFPADPQGSRAPGEMAARYGGKLFLVDVGMSYAVGYSSGALLRIAPGEPSATALYPDGTTRRLWP
jgi:hypothetical protein